MRQTTAIALGVSLAATGPASAQPAIPVLEQIYSIQNDAGSNEVAVALAMANGRLLVGAPRAFSDIDGVQQQTGLAYLYDAATGTELHVLEPARSSAALGQPDSFGAAVALNNNFAVVGAPTRGLQCLGAGATFWYSPTTGDLKGEVSRACGIEQRSGSAVALSGSRAFVGVPFMGAGVFPVGDVDVFNLSNGASVGDFGPNNPTFDMQFGAAIAVDGNDVIVGARSGGKLANDAAVQRAYLFDANTLAQRVQLTPPPRTPSVESKNDFGVAVSVKDGIAAVGDHGREGPSLDEAVFVFDATNGAWLSTFRQPGDGVVVGTDSDFGIAVDMDSGLLVVGAPDATSTSGTSFGGAAWIFDIASGEPIAELRPFPEELVGGFGSTVAIEGNLVAVSVARFFDAPEAVFVFDLSRALEGCNSADFAEPYGQLNAADLTAFISNLDAAKPSADVAEPRWTHDFFDLLETLRAFDAGCP
ncbi:MAG: hypothetical protein AAF297_00795 [Planctomycetota bacterium]